MASFFRIKSARAGAGVSNFASEFLPLRAVVDLIHGNKLTSSANMMSKKSGLQPKPAGSGGLRHLFENRVTVPTRNDFIRSLSSTSASQSSSSQTQHKPRKEISAIDEGTDYAPTYNIPEKPVTYTEAASYSVVILAGLGLAGFAAYGVCKELIFEPKEYKVFGKALERVKNDSQVRVRIGSPIKGYGQETKNRHARQRIPNRIWTDEQGVEHVEINFVVRGSQGKGDAFAEMFYDKVDKEWKFTYLIVQIKTPSPAQLILESYLPA